MDKQYIEELRALEDKKEAKAKLIEYAESFNIKVKKSKGFDSLVLEIEEAFKVLAAEPVDETEGLSIGDLIDAADEAEGKFVQNDVKEEAALLFDAPTEQPTIIEVQVQIPEIELRKPEVRVEAPIGEVVEPQPVLSENTLEEAVVKIIESEKPVFELPKNFSPHLILMGKNPGYVTVPWWIYQWISETPNWKENPTGLPIASGHQTVLSLLYYIQRNGSILIRETRNSSFITLS